MVKGLLSPRGSQITTTTVAGTGFAMTMTQERCLLVLEFFFCFFLDQGIGSRSAAWASRVDVVWVSVCVSSIVGWCCYVWWCCIRVALYASCMYPHILCNVDVMISTLQKRFNMRFYPWWDLRVPLGYGHILGVISWYQSQVRPTIGAPLIDRVVWPLSSLEENFL